MNNRRTDPRLTTLWLEQMQSFTDAPLAQITTDPRAQKSLTGHDTEAVASVLAQLSEWLYHLSATRIPPFDNQDTHETLVYIWTAVLHRT